MTNSKRTERFRLLYDLGCAFAARIELDELIPLIVAKCREVLNAEGISVLLFDQEHDELFFPYVFQEDPRVTSRLADVRFPAELGIAGEALKTGQAIRLTDAQADPRLYHGVDQITGLTTRDLLAAPLTSQQSTIGVIEAVNHRGETPFSDDDLAFLEALAESIAIAIKNARSYTQLKDTEANLRTSVGALRRDLARHDLFTMVLGASPAMTEVFRLMESAAGCAITVLIEGETGTGKELVARGIHRASARGEDPFLAINCAALPETLLESELFGHRRGAFTGAVRDNPGLFRAAAGGVIFLDEVSDMPMPMQAKLLRVLEEGEVVPLGESFPRKVDARVLSATNRDLKAEVKRGNFREDLYYRLAVFPIRLPPLRERRDDIPLLAGHFLNVAAERYHKRFGGFEPATLELLAGYGWPGNIRELRNEIDRAVALAKDGGPVKPGHLSPTLQAASSVALPAAAAPPTPAGASTGAEARAALKTSLDGTGHQVESLHKARSAFEVRYITEMLRQNRGNVSRTAQALGLSRATLQKKRRSTGFANSS